MQHIIDKVRKLLALSQSANAHEAASAAAKANQLIDEYRLSVGQLTPNEASATVDPIETASEPLLHSNRAMTWRKSLAIRLARHYGCFVWNSPRPRAAINYQVAGRKSDIEVLNYMFAYISTECDRITLATAKGRGRTFAESYRRGFVDGVLSQLDASRQTVAKASSDPQALVKLDDRTQDARRHVESSTHLSKGKAVTASRTDSTAFQSGRSAGRSMHLGASLSSASRTRLLSQ